MNLLEMDNFSQQDIEEIIRLGVEESINIEFKAAEALSKEPSVKKEISKDVSSFANSDGGLIFYGINEKDHVASSTSFINGHEFEKEWIENIIISNIQRRIQNLRIIPVRFDNDVTKTVYVVKIPRSEDAPHINGDKKYYRRFNFQSVAMEEYEVRNLYNKQHITAIRLIEPLIYGGKNPNSGVKVKDYTLRLTFRIENIGKAIEKLYKLEIGFHKYLYVHSRDSILDELKPFSSGTVEEYVLFSYPNKSPLFPNEVAQIPLPAFKIDLSTFSVLKKNPFKIKLYSTNRYEEESIDVTKYLSYDDRLAEESDFIV